jgi:glutathione-regulated potassium-efflux system ancillary protein KefG
MKATMVPRSDILLLFFHPLYHKSRVQRRLIGAIKELEGITFRNMYDIYPDFHIDVKREQDLLVRHDLIIWQHPLYWYSSPSLLKEWIDLVLEHGFAFGRKGRALEGKQVMSVVSTGGREETYMEMGANRYSLKQLLAPFEQTVTLCRMQYLPPFVVHGTHLMDEPGIIRAAEAYRKVLTVLRDGAYDPEKILSSNYINDLTNPQTT